MSMNIACLTTLPHRLDALEECVSKLAAMDCIDQVLINVPREAKRIKQSYDFERLARLSGLSPKITLNLVDEDDGPLTKLSASLDAVPYTADAYLILLDDDVAYTREGMESRIQLHEKDRPFASALFGRSVATDIIHQGHADVLEGFSTIMCHRKWYPKNRDELLKFVRRYFDQEVFFTDDLVISAWFALHGIPKKIYNVSFMEKGLANDDQFALRNENLSFRNRYVFDRYKMYFGKPMRPHLALLFIAIVGLLILTQCR